MTVADVATHGRGLMKMKLFLRARKKWNLQRDFQSLQNVLKNGP